MQVFQPTNHDWKWVLTAVLLGTCFGPASALAAQETPSRADDGGIATASCPPDLAPPGGNAVVNVEDLLAVIGAWGPCPIPTNCPADIAPPGPPIGNDIVNVADLLAVIGGWGACPCPGDALEPNNICAAARTLASLGSDQTNVLNTANLSASDVDYYRFACNETDSSCACCDGGPFCFDEDYTLTLQLTVPAAATSSYQFCYSMTDCNSFTNCLNVQPGSTGTFTIPLDGDCPGQDSYIAFVRIARTSPSGSECANYSFFYHFDALVCH